MSEGVLICDVCGGVVFINFQVVYLFSLEGVGQDILGLVDIGCELEFYGDCDWMGLFQEVFVDGWVQKECCNWCGMDLYLDMILVYVGDQFGCMLIVSFKDIFDVKQVMCICIEMLDFLFYDLCLLMVLVLVLIGKMCYGEDGEWLWDFFDNVEYYVQCNLNIVEQFL